MTAPADFSLVLGGPLYQALRSAHLTGDALQHLRRRIVVLTTLAWVPLLILSVVEGHAWGGVPLPFFYDVELHVRLLVAVPLLLLAELVVHRRVRAIVQQFLDRNLIPDPDLPRFHGAVASAMSLRNSVGAEVALIAFVYIVGVGIVWRTQTLDVASWHGALVNGVWRPSLAGWWLGLVSLPLFQFLLLRWYFRIFIWARFLWQVSRIPLQTHAGASGPRRRHELRGLRRLRVLSVAAGPGDGAGRDDGQPDLLRRREAARLQGGADRSRGLMLLALLGPLLVFSRQLEAAKRVGVREHGRAGAALRARVRSQVAAGRRSAG